MREKARATWEPAQQAAVVPEAAGVLVGRGHTQTRPGSEGPTQPPSPAAAAAPANELQAVRVRSSRSPPLFQIG